MLLRILVLLSLLTLPVLAEDQNIPSNQEVLADSNKAVVHVQKQPLNQNSTQKAELERNWFCIIIQCNGKAPYDKTSD